MKLAIFSDSHGYPDKMINAIYQCSPDMIIHLGDGNADIDKIKNLFPEIPLKAVRGNCDFFSVTPEMEIFETGNKKILITHGHLFGVKSSTASLIKKANALGADIVMYGHTHIAVCSKENKLHIINPGSCGYSSAASYAEVTIPGNGVVDCQIIKL